jgi:hypothetical protein
VVAAGVEAGAGEELGEAAGLGVSLEVALAPDPEAVELEAVELESAEAVAADESPPVAGGLAEA